MHLIHPQPSFAQTKVDGRQRESEFVFRTAETLLFGCSHQDAVADDGRRGVMTIVAVIDAENVHSVQEYDDSDKICHSENQIVVILKQVEDGLQTKDPCRVMLLPRADFPRERQIERR